MRHDKEKALFAENCKKVFNDVEMEPQLLSTVKYLI